MYIDPTWRVSLGLSGLKARKRNAARESMLSLAVVLLLHVAALYLVTRVTQLEMPQVSVPLMVSFAVSEPIPDVKVKPKPKPQPLAEAPVMADATPQEQKEQSQVMPPRFDVAHLNNPVPEYPLISKRLREHGEVMLRVHVTADGLASEVQIYTSSNYPRLDRAAQQAVQRWRFMPARRGDEPVGAWVLVPIQYIWGS
jgi:protein TonB